MEEDKTLDPLNNLPVKGKSYTLDEIAEYNDPERDASGDLPQPVEQAAYDYKPAWEKDMEEGYNVKLGEDLNGNDIVRTRADVGRISATRQQVVQDKELFEEYSKLNDRALASDTNQYRDVAFSKSALDNLAAGYAQFNANLLGGFLSGIGSWDLADGAGLVSGENREYGNIFFSAADWLREKANKNFKIYEKNPGGVEPGDSAWWATQFAQFGTSVGIGVEALLESAVITWATGGMGTMGAVAKGVNTAVRLRKLAQAGKLARFLKGSKALSKGANMALKSGTWGAWKGAQEGIIEGYESYHQTYQEYLDKGLSPKEAQKLASIAASTTYKEGVLPLMAINALQWSVMSVNPMTGATANKLIGKIGNKALRNTTENVTGLLSEGIEEMIQGFAQQSGEDAAAIEHGSLLSRGKRTIGDKLQDEENWNAFIGGVFGGAAFQGMGYIKNTKERKIGRERTKLYVEDSGKIFTDLKKMHKGVEELTKVGKTQEASLLQRKTNMYHTASMIHLDEKYDKEAGYEGIVDHYEAALKYANENDIEGLKEMGLSEDNIDHIKATYPSLIKDTKDINKTYKEALTTNEPEFAKEIAYNTAKIKADKEFLVAADLKLKEYIDTNPSLNFSNTASKEVLDKEGEIYHYDKQLQEITAYQKKLEVGSPEFFMAERQKEEIQKQKEEVEKNKESIIVENSNDIDFIKNQKELKSVNKDKYFSLVDSKKNIEEDVEKSKKSINKISSPKYQEDYIRERDYIKGMSSTNSKEIAEMLIELERKYYLNDERGIKIKEELASRITDINANTLKNPVTKKEETKVRNLDEEDKTEIQKEVEKVADLDSIERKEDVKVTEEIVEIKEELGENVTLTEKQKETQEILIDVIENSRKFGAPETVDGKSFYKKGKELFERVSNYLYLKLEAKRDEDGNLVIKEDVENEAAKKGQAVGNFVDFIGRDIFKGKAVSREEYIKEANDYNQDKGNPYLLTDSSVSQEVFDSLVKIFTDTKNHLEKTGHTFLSDDMTVSSPIKEAIGKANGVAGTLDLIAINKEGVVQIIDFKNIVFNGSMTNTQHLDKVFTKTSNWTPKAEQWARQQTMYKRLLELAGLTVDTVNVLPISTEYKSEGDVITISKVIPLHKRKEEGSGLTKAIDKEGKYKISNLSENIIELEEHERTNDIMDNDFGTNEVIQEDFTQVIDGSLFEGLEGAIPNTPVKNEFINLVEKAVSTRELDKITDQATANNKYTEELLQAISKKREELSKTSDQETISEQDIVEKKSVLDNFLNDPSGYIYNQEELDTLVEEGVIEKDCD